MPDQAGAEARSRAMGQRRVPRRLQCPGCGNGLEPLALDVIEADCDARRMVCPSCGETFRARRRVADSPSEPGASQGGPMPLGPLALFWRGATLRGLEWTYRAGVVAGSATLLACGGFVPVARGWLQMAAGLGPLRLSRAGVEDSVLSPFVLSTAGWRWLWRSGVVAGAGMGALFLPQTSSNRVFLNHSGIIPSLQADLGIVF